MARPPTQFRALRVAMPQLTDQAGLTWTIEEILRATNGQLTGRWPRTALGPVTINSRSLVPGEVFVAIRGARLDGHHFVDEAVARGASCLIVSRPVVLSESVAAVPLVLVNDTTRALAELGRFRRRQLDRPVIAVTGSCGKTTTKELIAHVLETPDQVLKTAGTQNNHIGVPLTLLRMNPLHRYAVVELGSNHPGEISGLASIVEPDLAVVTNVGPVHLEFFGSLMGVLHEKLSLLDAVPADGTVVLPGDQLEICLEAPRYLKPGVRIVTFGLTDRCDIQAVDIRRTEQGMAVRLRDHVAQWRLPIVGVHNVENMLAAVACAWAIGVPLSVVRDRLATFSPVPMRSQLVQANGVTILNDCYNANPLSVARALETLCELPVRRRVAIVGDMLELGEYTAPAHQAIGRLAAKLGVESILAVGEHASHVRQGASDTRPDAVTTYHTVPELLADLPSMIKAGDGVLVKGSRRLNLERVTEFLTQPASRGQL